jgi:signal transduction histidine kinase
VSVSERAWATAGADSATLDVTEPLPTVPADSERLEALLSNLFRNAIEHGGREVTVEVGGLEDTSGFYVADDGSGFDDADPEQLFDYGYTTNESGTGFGLSIVAEIAEAHGWKVQVADSADCGARFEFRT